MSAEELLRKARTVLHSISNDERGLLEEEVGLLNEIDTYSDKTSIPITRIGKLIKMVTDRSGLTDGLSPRSCKELVDELEKIAKAISGRME